MLLLGNGKGVGRDEGGRGSEGSEGRGVGRTSFAPLKPGCVVLSRERRKKGRARARGPRPIPNIFLTRKAQLGAGGERPGGGEGAAGRGGRGQGGAGAEKGDTEDEGEEEEEEEEGLE